MRYVNALFYVICLMEAQYKSQLVTLVIIAPLNLVNIVINWCILPNKSVLIVKCVRYNIFKLDPLLFIRALLSVT